MAKDINRIKRKVRFTKNNSAAKGNKSTKGQSTYRKEEKIIAIVDQKTISRYLSLNAGLTLSEMKEKLKERNRKNITMLEYMILRAMVVTAQTGDTTKLNFFFDRLVGRVPQVVKHGLEDPYESKTDEELMEIRRKLNETNRIIMNRIEQTDRVKEQSKIVEAKYRELETNGDIEPTEFDSIDSSRE